MPISNGKLVYADAVNTARAEGIVTLKMVKPK